MHPHHSSRHRPRHQRRSRHLAHLDMTTTDSPLPTGQVDPSAPPTEQGQDFTPPQRPRPQDLQPPTPPSPPSPSLPWLQAPRSPPVRWSPPRVTPPPPRSPLQTPRQLPRLPNCTALGWRGWINLLLLKILMPPASWLMDHVSRRLQRLVRDILESHAQRGPLPARRL